MGEGNYRRARDKTVNFPIESGLMPVSGFALVNALDEETGDPIISYLYYGKTKPVEIIGLLTTALDQYRNDFIDRETSILDDEAFEDEDDEEE